MSFMQLAIKCLNPNLINLVVTFGIYIYVCFFFIFFFFFKLALLNYNKYEKERKREREIMGIVGQPARAVHARPGP